MPKVYRQFIRAVSVLFAALALALPGSAQTEQAEPDGHVHEEAAERSVSEVLKDVWTRDKLLGDWRGLRTDLHDHGIDIGLRLSQYRQRVASGGVDKNGEYGGTMDYRVNADLNKLLGLWEGLSVTMHARTRFGEDVLANAGGLTRRDPLGGL